MKSSLWEIILSLEVGNFISPFLGNLHLPFTIDYKSTISDDLAADTWVAKVAGNALSLLWDRPQAMRVSPGILDDLVAALKAKGIDLGLLKETFNSVSDWGKRLDAAMEVLRSKGINHLWVVVDEVETPGDLKRNPDYQAGAEINEEDLTLISQVVKEARYREQHPYVNFLLLCSLGMSDVISIGPNLRRSSRVTLQPNHISDIVSFRDYLKERDIPVDYPNGTIEGVFVATNRNFGWFNVVMSSIHTSWEQHKKKNEARPAAWQLIEEYARSEARSEEVFDLSILKLIEGVPPDLQGQLVFGQLPLRIDATLSSTALRQLLSAEIPGIGRAFARLVQIHIDESTLANEIVKDQYGFKKADRPGDDYFNSYTEFSVSGVLTALRAFSVAVGEDGDFLVYEDPDQFVEQLATLYPRSRLDENKRIEQAAEPLHQIFKQFIVADREFVAASFKLLKKIDVKMSADSRNIAFFMDPKLNEKLDLYVNEQKSNNKKRMDAICRGLAKILDDNPRDLKSIQNLKSRHVAFESEFSLPYFGGLAVTTGGRVTVLYCDDVSQTAQDLSAMLGLANESVHPIIALFGPDGDPEGLEREIRNQRLSRKCVIPRKLTAFEEDFLIKYSGRDLVFDVTTSLSQHALATLGGLRQALGHCFDGWRKELEEDGFIIQPIWFKPVPGKDDFYRGYRYLVAKNESGTALDPAVCKLPEWGSLNFDNFNKAAEKNVDPGKGYSVPCLPILEKDPFKPIIPKSLVRVFKEMKMQVGEDSLGKRFFFPAKEVKGSQAGQIIEFLQALGVVVSPTQGQFKAISKAVLDEQKTKAENWLNNTAKQLIEELRDMFPMQAASLEKGYKAAAIHNLQRADTIAATIDFSFLDEEEPNPEKFAPLVTGVYEFQQALLGICPLDPNQAFSISTEQIKTFQNKYKDLSFWDKVQFLLWLRNEFAKKRSNVCKAIDEQLADAADYATIDGYGFPISPLTLPLKSIKSELESGLAGHSSTLRDFLRLSEYPLSIKNYLMQDDYDKAWRRLIQLSELVSKDDYRSIWQKLIQLFNEWKNAVVQFSKAKEAWDDLVAFMEGAPSELWSEADAVRRTYENLRDQVEGGLKNDIDQSISTCQGLELLEKLGDEIQASSSKFPGLVGSITDFHTSVKNRLRKIINDQNLQALNHLLRAEGKAEWQAPMASNTYKATKTAYEAFNAKVAEEGRACLEGNGRQTNWDLWVDIYAELSSGKYMKKTEHEGFLTELEEMGLVKTTIVLA